ncbi:hypothetical protein PoB_007661000 [Plakobranchus ocellatus]|uniref:Uncharacterized protein n=1 Tax=Plakobranchus ocellatus TaxID=259542 RepID=A0AAV4E1F1_9GAST|nr:hypothetical protein PoB_007661000 [Plakobranchus ocellatus]
MNLSITTIINRQFYPYYRFISSPRSIDNVIFSSSVEPTALFCCSSNAFHNMMRIASMEIKQRAVLMGRSERADKSHFTGVARALQWCTSIAPLPPDWLE